MALEHGSDDFIQKMVNKSPSTNTLSDERWEQLASGAEFVEEELQLAEQMVETEGGAELFFRVLATARKQAVKGKTHLEKGISL